MRGKPREARSRLPQIGPKPSPKCLDASCARSRCWYALAHAVDGKFTGVNESVNAKGELRRAHVYNSGLACDNWPAGVER